MALASCSSNVGDEATTSGSATIIRRRIMISRTGVGDEFSIPADA
jgi:hypothetical protein